ncbi:hypothetical protein GGR51DRAFT_522968 [Nemania sp. FL0031]|nr:hypothetical protein GGR51DRAFT_522968 [Nemania sp. FL0031]
MEIVAYACKGGLVHELREDMPLDHGVGGVLILQDIPEKRRRGSMMWGVRRMGVGGLIVKAVS